MWQRVSIFGGAHSSRIMCEWQRQLVNVSKQVYAPYNKTKQQKMWKQALIASRVPFIRSKRNAGVPYSTTSPSPTFFCILADAKSNRCRRYHTRRNCQVIRKQTTKEIDARDVIERGMVPCRACCDESSERAIARAMTA